MSRFFVGAGAMAAAMTAVLAFSPLPVTAQNSEPLTKEQCDAAYLAIFDALDHRGPDKPYVSEEAQEWALDYQGKHRRGELCDSLPVGYSPADSLTSGTAALKSLVGETAFKAGMVHIAEGDRALGIAKFKRACDVDHADGCFAYATYVGFQMGSYDVPEVVAVTQKACRLGSQAACKSERNRTGAGQ